MELQNNLRPYLINAFYTWCVDYGFTPLIKVINDDRNTIPSQYKNKDFSIFNVHPKSIRNLIFSKLSIEFQAQFGGEVYQIVIFYETILKIYHKEGASALDFSGTAQNFKEFNIDNLPHLTSVENKSSHLTLVRK